MSHRPGLPRRAAILPLLLLAACQSAPPAPEAPPHSAPTTEISPFEQDQLERARRLSRLERHGEAAVHWEVLSLLQPDNGAYRDALARARQDAAQLAAAHLDRARSALAAGNEDKAAEHFLRALSLDPANRAASDGLRSIERERNRRYFLGRPSRLTMGRTPPEMRAASPAKPAPARAPAASEIKPAENRATEAKAPGDRGELEHASLLMREGEYTEALAMLTRYAKANPRDPEGPLALARAWEEFGDDSLAKGRPEAALRAYERARSYQNGNGAALDGKLRNLRKALGER